MQRQLYPLQQTLASRVVDRLNQGHRYVALVSPMQSGKTGTIAAIARLVSDAKQFTHTYFMTGVNDLMVREQNLVALASEPIEVLDKYDLNNTIQEGTVAALCARIKQDSLLIIDEAHWGVGATGLLSTPFKEAIDTLGCAVVAVSATNYTFQGSRLGANLDPVAPTQEELDSAGYVGLHSFLTNGQVQGIPEPGTLSYSAAFFQMLEDFSRSEPSYLILRPGNHHADNRLRKLLAATVIDTETFDLVEWNVGTGTLFTADTFGLQPTKHTVVVIKDFLRMGKVIPVKKYIWGVWEEGGTNMATAVQGLYGRLCGYDRSSLNSRIYAKAQFLKDYVVLQQQGFTTSATGDVVSRLASNVRTLRASRTVSAPVEITSEEAKELRATGKYTYHNIAEHSDPKAQSRFISQAFGESGSTRGIYATSVGVIWELDGTRLSHPKLVPNKTTFLLQQVQEGNTVSLKSRRTMYDVPVGEQHAKEARSRRRG